MKKRKKKEKRGSDKGKKKAKKASRGRRGAAAHTYRAIEGDPPSGHGGDARTERSRETPKKKE